MESANLTIKSEQEAVFLNERIRANGQAAVNAVCAIGRDLRRMKIEGLYTHLGYDSFEEYAEQEHNLKRRQAYQYISVYENLGEDFVQSNAQLGITKLALLTQIDAQDRAEIINENDLSEMTVNEIKELLDKMKQQGEQLSMFESQINEFKDKEKEFESADCRIKSLQARLDDTGDAMRKTAAEKQEIEKKNAELEARIKELESRPVEVAVPEPEIKEEVEKLKKSYEERIAELNKPACPPVSNEKSSFKLLYTEAYKSCLGLVEFIKNTDDDEKELFTEKTDKLLDAVRETLHS